MTDRYPAAFLLSLLLHGAIAGVMFLFGYAASLSKPDETFMTIEMIAGEGNELFETKAPKLGDPTAVKMDLPKPAPEEIKPREATPPPEPPAAAPVPPMPVEKPTRKAPEEKPVPKPPDLAKNLTKKIDRADAKAKAAIEKERKLEATRLTKEQFDKENKKKVAAATPAGPPKIAKIDTAGIVKGVVEGSSENKKGGAGGKALVRTDGPVMDVYISMLREKLRNALIKPPGLSDSLVTEIQVRINPDGSLTGARITRSSGSSEFDAAAMAAVAAVEMPAHPMKRSELLTLPFKMKELE